MRHADWQKRFWSALEEQRARAFAYGECDCILFAASMADTITVDGGYVTRARAAFNWGTRTEAEALLVGTELRALIETALGPIQPWPRLHAGDLVLCNSPTAEEGEPPQMLCVHDGTSPIAKAHRRLVTLDWSRALGGWRIT